MKTVQGTGRTYQLVQKTKKKDIDGVVYLAAGEKDLWVKLLKDRSRQKELEVRSQVKNGYGPMFDIPLDVVSDSAGFVGYTFKGPEMPVVPVKEDPAPGSSGTKPAKKKDPAPGPDGAKAAADANKNGRRVSGDGAYSAAVPENPYGLAGDRMIVTLSLVFCALLLFGIHYLWLNRVFANTVYQSFGSAIAQGCVTFGLNGMIAGVFGVTVIIWVMRRLMARPMHVAMALLCEAGIFLLGILAADLIILMLVILITAILGTIQQYMSSIITVLVILFLIWALLPKRR